MNREPPPATLKEAIDRLRAMRDSAIKDCITAAMNERITPQWMFVRMTLINQGFRDCRDVLVDFGKRED